MSRKRSAEVGTLEDLSVLRRSSVDEISRSGIGIPRELGNARLPVGRDDFRNGKTRLGVEDGRREELRERPAPEAGPKHLPPVESAGHRDREDVVVGNALEPALPELLGRRERSGTAGGVQPVELLRVRVVDEREEVTADARHHRLDHVEGRRGRDGGIDRVPSFLEDAKARGRRERLARRHDPARREDG